MKGKTHSAETKARIAEKLRARMSDPAVRAKVSADTKAGMADPAVRQRIRDGMAGVAAAAAEKELTSVIILRAAWYAAPPSARKRFIEEILLPAWSPSAAGETPAGT